MSPTMFKPGDKVVVFKLDGTEIRGVVVLIEVSASRDGLLAILDKGG